MRTSSRTVDGVISDLASRTCSIVHARDLRSAGIGRDAVASRVHAGTMAIVLPRTYAVGPQCRQPSREMLCMAGVLAGGPGAVVDGPTAGELLDVWDRGGDGIHIAIPRTACGAHRAPPAFRFHRVDGLWQPDVTLHHGPIPTLGFVDMCLRMARSLTKWQLAFVIGRGIYLRLVTLTDLDAIVAARAGCPWITVLRAALDVVRAGSAGTRGRTEDHLLDGLRAAGVAEPLVNMRGALGLSRDEPDLYWPTVRLNVEVDGGHHDAPSQQEDDARRDAEAEALGIRVYRFRPRDVWRRRSLVVGLVKRALAGEALDVRAGTRYARIR